LPADAGSRSFHVTGVETCALPILSIKFGLPVIIHSRDAHGDTTEILKKYSSRLKGCVLHCYSGSWEMAKVYADMGFMISLAGPEIGCASWTAGAGRAPASKRVRK